MTAASLLEIDLGAIADNWRHLDAMHGGATAGVIKADAYGLGATQVAPALAASGCRHFFTAHLGEALAVRPYVPQDAMLAVMHGVLPGEEKDFLAHGIVPVLGAPHEIALWRDEARRQKRVLPAFLHVDTGMARLGLSVAELTRMHNDASLLEGLDILYVMTHLVSSEQPDDPMNAAQLTRFQAARALFPAAQKISIANSSGMFLGEGFASDLARPGAALYGLNPSPGKPNPMRNVVRLTARILQIHEVEPGETVGYNAAWTATRPSRIATIAVGYADGFLRSLTNQAMARFDDQPIPLVGRVSMDLTTFDVTGTLAAPGDRLELMGPAHDADALAAEAGTNGYEILTSLGGRYDRRYIGGSV